MNGSWPSSRSRQRAATPPPRGPGRAAGPGRPPSKPPLEHVEAEHASAPVVDVVGVPVVGEVQRRDRLQRRRGARRGLHAGEAAPRDARHAHRSRCTTAARRASRSRTRRRPAPGPCTRRRAGRPSRRCRAGRAADRRSRGRRGRRSGTGRPRPCRRPCGRARPPGSRDGIGRLGPPETGGEAAAVRRLDHRWSVRVTRCGSRTGSAPRDPHTPAPPACLCRRRRI